jgi:hypothetical protein
MTDNGAHLVASTNYYAILGVARDADVAAIKRKFLALSLTVAFLIGVKLTK